MCPPERMASGRAIGYRNVSHKQRLRTEGGDMTTQKAAAANRITLLNLAEKLGTVSNVSRR